jgi:glycosyltransferase involved in cell wall biosynthesis
VYALMARLLGCRVIYQVHGGALPDDFCRGNPFLNWLLARILCASDAVVLLAQVELAAYGKFVPTAHLELIANAIDIDTLACEAIAEKGERTLHLAYMGRLIEEKGIFDAVQALAMLVREKRAVTLSIAGSGPQEGQLRARVADLGLDDRVHFLGPLFDAPKEALWRSAHIFVFPTFFLEGLPYALLEAMAAGAVPVTTRAGAIPDVLEDGVHGLLVPVREPAVLAAAIARLDDDRRSLARMAEAGRRQVVEHYTLARLADDFRKLYSSIV